MRDYRSFSSIARTRFRPVAEQLGYAPYASTAFARPHPEGWHEVFWLHTGWSGGDFFSVYYGIAATGLYPDRPAMPLQQAPVLLNRTLHNSAGSTGLGRADRAQVSASAEAVASLYRQQALPWLDGFKSWQDIATEFAHTQSQWLSEAQRGQYSEFFSSQAIYGLLLLKAGQTRAARRWLHESRRLLLGNAKREDWEETFLKSVTHALQRLDDSATIAKVEP